MKKVLLVGETWMVHVQETKGFDIFTNDYYEEGFHFLKDALESEGIEFVNIPSHMVEKSFPTTLEEMKKYDVIMVSDCGANTFNLPMSTFIGLNRNVNKLELIKEYVEDGGAFVMIGGYLTFQGIQARGAYKRTAIEEILPVTLHEGDDRNECCQGVSITITDKDHPVFDGIAEEELPMLLGYNRLIPKNNAQVIAKIGEDPFIALGSYGKGKTCAYATDCAPHWAPTEFCTSDNYRKLWKNLVNWLS